MIYNEPVEKKSGNCENLEEGVTMAITNSKEEKKNTLWKNEKRKKMR